MPRSKVSKQQAEQNILFRIRHSAAHLMAAAVLKLFPGSKLGTGPATQQGFFYDIQTAKPLTDKDLPAIEKEVQKLIAAGHAFTCEQMDADKAIAHFEKSDQPYKVELIKELQKEGHKTVSIYRTGDVFVDLCEGPHVDTSKEVGAFKLLSLAGAYWKGNEKNPQMTRIHGTAFSNKQELTTHLNQLAEAKKRDHKKMGIDLDLFTFSPLVGSGLPLWTPRGTVMRTVLDEFVWQLRKQRGYVRVEIPHITKKELYEKSGHWEKFQDELFKIKTREGHTFVMKPMNCPHHTQIFARRPHSYREMPQRYANTTMVYRDEQSGELSGLVRVRAITQDDGHVFCRYSQMKDEVFSIWDIVNEFYAALGFNLRVRLSLHDPQKMDKYLGTPEIWEKAESQLRALIHEKKAEATEALGEAALYGPKIDFIADDSIGREHQVATIQLDLNLPDRFDLTCVNEKGEKERILMIHTAIMGSIERLLGVAIEHFGGAFPAWLAPVQVAILPISEKQLGYAQEVQDELAKHGIRVETTLSDDTIGKKIRRAELLKVPYLAVVGDKEIAAKKVAIRVRGKGDLGAISVKDLAKKISDQVAAKSLSLE
jgi:threonyl-tRNA synthetase